MPERALVIGVDEGGMKREGRGELQELMVQEATLGLRKRQQSSSST